MAIVENSTIMGNRTGCQYAVYLGRLLWVCGSGGGISNSGTLTLINSTISGNSTRAEGFGGGGRGGRIANYGTLFLRNITITNNIAPYAGGLANYYGSVNFQNSLCANNLDMSNQPSDCGGSLTSYGYNIIGNTARCTIAGDMTGNLFNVGPMLGPLQDNGGPTLTHALLPGSPAIDAGNPATPNSGSTACQSVDQRGVVRPQDGDGDGLLDLVMHFRTQQTGLQPSDTQACLEGQLQSGMAIRGCDAIRIVP